MTVVWGVVWTVAGAGVVLFGLRDMFYSLLHPTSQGTLGRTVRSRAWELSRATGHRIGGVVGPGAMGVTVVLWVLVQAVGWALVYLPHVPAGFSYSPGSDPSRYPHLMEAVYISLVGLATLGLGDVVPVDPWMRLAVPLEALTGFALLTAALTWFTQIHPPLVRRRSLALELQGLAAVRWHEAVATADPGVVTRVLDSVIRQVLQARIDLSQYSETYTFREADDDLSLAVQLPYAVVLRDAALGAPAPEVALDGARLDDALQGIARMLAEDFGCAGDSVEEVFASFAVDHGHAPRTAGA